MRIVVCGNDHDQQCRIALTKLGWRQVRAIDAGQSQIEHNEIEIIGIGENGAAGFAIGSLHDRHLRIELAQGLPESFTDKSMVFNDKQFQHGDSQ